MHCPVVTSRSGASNSPYVVIQNTGANLDTPKFLNTDYVIENAADGRLVP